MSNRLIRVGKFAAVFTAAAAFGTFGLSQAKPPAPPAPPPAGSILYMEPYVSPPTDYQMKADGSQRTPLAPPGERNLEWSYFRYGSDAARWFVRFEFVVYPDGSNRRQIFASRVANGVVNRRVQITDFPWTIRGYSGRISPRTEIRWTKGSDGFLSFLVNERVLDENGVYQYGPDLFYRLNVSASELEAATSNGGSFTPVPIGDPRLFLVFPDVPPSAGIWSDYGWSADGATLAWAQNDVLEIHRGLGSGSPTVQVMPTTARTINWSVAGDKIAVHGTPNGQTVGGIVSVDPVNATATLVKAASASVTYSVPSWSIDGAHLVAMKRTVPKSGRGETAIVRMNANGTGETTINVLGNIVGGNGFVWDWMSDDVAP